MNFLVFQHLSVEHPGIFRNFWQKDAISWEAIELDEGEAIPENLEDYDALIVMGGPMDVWEIEKYPWLINEQKAIAKWVLDLKKPFLGVCLGHQLLAQSIGGSVKQMTNPEVGVCKVNLTPEGRKDLILASMENQFECLQWHGVEVESLPNGSTILAANEHCNIQAFRYGDNAYGIQYHIEILSSTIDEWAKIPEYKQSLEAVMGVDALNRLRTDVDKRLEYFNLSARLVNNQFMSLLSACK